MNIRNQNQFVVGSRAVLKAVPAIYYLREKERGKRIESDPADPFRLRNFALAVQVVVGRIPECERCQVDFD